MIPYQKSFYALVGLLICLFGCRRRKINEAYAAQQVKKALSLTGRVSAQILSGGYSGTPIFVVTDAKNIQYVIRFLEHTVVAKREREIIGLKHASDQGYGPHIYFIAPENSYVIMQCIEHQKIPAKLRESVELYQMLAHVLQKIHQGPALPIPNKTIFQRVYKTLNDISEYKDVLPLEKIENLIKIIEKVLALHMTLAPCHNDLNPNNLLFLGNEFKVIDFESIGQQDPYFDVATVSIFFCFVAQTEDVLFKTYFGHEPTDQEKAKLFFMKQLVRMHYALAFFKLGEKSLVKYNELPNLSHVQFVQQLSSTNNESFGDAQYAVQFGKILLNQAFVDLDSPKFEQAICALQKL